MTDDRRIMGVVGVRHAFSLSWATCHVAGRHTHTHLLHIHCHIFMRTRVLLVVLLLLLERIFAKLEPAFTSRRQSPRRPGGGVRGSRVGIGRDSWPRRVGVRPGGRRRSCYIRIGGVGGVARCPAAVPPAPCTTVAGLPEAPPVGRHVTQVAELRRPERVPAAGSVPERQLGMASV